MHRVIAGVAPGLAVIDITHQIPAYDVRAGALTLWRAAPWLTPGVVLAVVDPGVGTARRPVAIEVAGANTYLVGPDNGLLIPAARRCGQVSAAVELAHYAGGRVGATFDGRDLFAPAAARLAAGAELSTLGPAVDPASLAGEAVTEAVPDPDGRIQASVLWVDRFGNVQLDANPKAAADLGPKLQIRTAAGAWDTRRVGAYDELQPHELGLFMDAYGAAALCCNRGSAAELTGLSATDSVWLEPPPGTQVVEG